MALRDATKPVTPAPVGDLAVSDSRESVARGFTWRRYNPDDLVGRKSLRIYDEMRRDEQVKACLMVKKAAIVGPGWKLEPGDETPAAEKLTDTITQQLKALPGTFEDVLLHALDAFDYGFSLQEKSFAMEKGAIVLKEIRSIAPHNITFDMDAFGHIEAIRQDYSGAGDPMPVEKFIHFVHQPEFGNSYGTSDLRSVYRPYFHKQNWLQWWAIWGEKLADQPVKVSFPVGTSSEKITQVLDTADRLQAKTSLAVPEGWDISLLESGRNVRDVFLTSIDRHDLSIAKGILVPDKLGLVGGTVTGGSYGLSKTQLGVFMFILNLYSARLIACIQEQLIDQLADLIDPTAAKPKFVMLPIEDQNIAAILDSVSKLITVGAMKFDLEDENHTRRLLEYPEVTEEQRKQLEAQLQAEADAAAQRQKDLQQQQPPGGGNGNAPQSADGNGPPGSSKPNPNGSGGSDGKSMAETEPPFARALTPLEARADMAEKQRTFDELAPPFAEALAKGSQALIRDLKAQAESLGLASGDVSPEALGQLRMNPQVLAMMQGDVERALKAGYDRGAREAQGEVARAKE